ncbi:MAG: hypothetical protein M3340_08865 [Actinomycetota bacterium]|nr:hypothetical protein [Actinomycetota bacterium]
MTGLAPSGEITRRTLLLAGAGAAATAAIPDIAMAAQKRLRKRSHLDRATWEPLIGTVLETRNPGLPPVPLTLMKVADLPGVSEQTGAFRERSFVLVFSGPTGQPLGDGMHVLRVPGAGKISIWFADSDLTAAGWTYVAIFANAKRRQGRVRKPRGKGSRKQSREHGERARPQGETRRKKARKAKRRRDPEAAPKAAPAKPEEPAPAKPEEPAPKPAPESPADAFE